VKYKVEEENLWSGTMTITITMLFENTMLFAERMEGELDCTLYKKQQRRRKLAF
jgi:hypothetical protein